MNRVALATGWMVCINFFLNVSAAADWAQWRGPHLNGSTSETGLPEKLDPESNLIWKQSLPAGASSTPVIYGDRIFLSALDPQSKKLLALCLETSTGKELWRRETGDGFQTTNRITLAGPSPVTDGKTVWFYYGSGDLAAFDMEGKALWSRNLQSDYGPFNYQWLYCSSPLLHDGKLYIQVLHRDIPTGTTARGYPAPSGPAESYLLGIDPATGKNLFRVIRPNDAVLESKESYGTPMPYEANGRKQILIVGGDCLTGHDAETGTELWRFGGWNPRRETIWRVVPSLVIVEDKAIVCTPQPQGKILAVKLGGSGDITATHKAWENTQTKSDVPSPALYQNKLYVLDGDFRKGLSCLDVSTGQTQWSTPIPSRPVLRSSPTAADGKIYVMNENAEVWVVSAADGKILSQTQLATEGQVRGTIVAAQGKVFVRTGSTLYCFGQP